jgi:hypothetical protein
MQFKDYKKYLLFIFTFLCCGFIKAQPGLVGEIYLKNINREKYDVLAYAFKDSDSIKTLYSKEAVTELIPVEVTKYTYNATVGVNYIQEGHLYNKLLIEIFDKNNTNSRMTILAVGGFEYYLHLLININSFIEGLFLLEIPANYEHGQLHKSGGIWDLSLALKKIH